LKTRGGAYGKAAHHLLFDAGRGAIQRIHSLGIPFGKIDKLFITHLHSDHTAGLADVFLTSWLHGRRTPFHVWGPRGTQTLMQHTLSAYADDMHSRIDQNDGAKASVAEIREGLVYERDGLVVTAFDVDHVDNEFRVERKRQLRVAPDASVNAPAEFSECPACR